MKIYTGEKAGIEKDRAHPHALRGTASGSMRFYPGFLLFF
jgi:hypothetical protein